MKEKWEETQRKKRTGRINSSKAHAAHLSLSLSSLLRERSLFSGSRSLSLSWFVTEELRSESLGLGHCGGVGKDGGVRWSLFHGSWGLLKFCRFGPSLWVKMLLWARITAGEEEGLKIIQTKSLQMHFAQDKVKPELSFQDFLMWSSWRGRAANRASEIPLALAKDPPALLRTPVEEALAVYVQITQRWLTKVHSSFSAPHPCKGSSTKAKLFLSFPHWQNR